MNILNLMNGNTDDYISLENIVSEKKLLTEAAKTYLSYNSPETLYWEFLLKYDVDTGTLEGSSYRGMFERLYIKHGKRDLPKAVKELLPAEVYCRVQARDTEAGKTTRKLDPELRALYNKIDSKSVTGKKLKLKRPAVVNIAMIGKIFFVKLRISEKLN